MDEIEINDVNEYELIPSILPIEFVPLEMDEFKAELIRIGSAIITIHYNNGTSEAKIWKASYITEKSDIIHNVRSRKEFRQRNWQDSNINKLVIHINN